MIWTTARTRRITLGWALALGVAGLASGQTPAERATRAGQWSTTPKATVERQADPRAGGQAVPEPRANTGVGRATTRTSSGSLEVGGDDAGICCRFQMGGREATARRSRADCLRGGGSEAEPDACSSRPRGGDSLVCCQYVTFSTGLGAFRSRATRLMGADRCQDQDGKVVARSECVDHSSRRDRLYECRGRGEGWVWKDGRCQRSAVRDKR